MKCCVPSCGITGDNYPPTVVNNREQVTFHEFPTILWLRKAWLLAIGIQECFLPQGAVVCSRHFEKNDFSNAPSIIVRLRKNSVPSVFKEPNCETSTIEFCLICLDTSASKLFLLNQNSNLARAYSNITGHDVSVIRDHINTEPKLCLECAQRLTNCVTFKDKTLRAHSILIQLLQKDKIITSQSLNSVDRLENLLISNLGKLAYEPDHCDLYVIEEDNNTEIENIVYYPEVNIENLKSKDETMSNCSETDCEVKELDNIHNEIQAINSNINKDHKLNNSDNKNIITKNSSQARNNDKKYKYDVIINPVTSNNCKVENDKADVFIISDGDDEMKCLDSDIDDGIKHDMGDDIDDINDDIDIDEDYDNDEHANDSHSSDRLTNKIKVCNNFENRVSLNNLIFVKYTKPITHDDLDHGTDELLNGNYSYDKLSKKLKIDNNSENRVSLDNVIFVKDTRPIIQHKDFISRKNNTNQNLNRVYGTNNHNGDKIMLEEINDDSCEYKNGSNVKNCGKSNKKRLPRVRAPRKRRLRRKRDKKPPTYVPRPKTRDCKEKDLKSFTRTWLTYEEQIADIQKRKNSVHYKRSAYKCEICFKGSWQLSTYNRHMDKHTDVCGAMPRELAQRQIIPMLTLRDVIQ
ncbi:GRIP and coiled-coil domain-containing protein-like isoform X2 [Maniola hyperantus]|uniref:GRIP and coiled-coil domain-containing protein-like isoform X2 n=1 Tax=Aphantopus hyperantus TaxID=2795564 RepID=UPI003747AA90